MILRPAFRSASSPPILSQFTAALLNALYALTNAFAAGQDGAVYQPYDPNTVSGGSVGMLQDATGTTPVTAVEQPVGLALDTRLGLVRGAELVTNGTFDATVTDWFAIGTGGSAASVGGVCEITGSGGGFPGLRQTLAGLTIGRSYELTWRMAKGTSNGSASFSVNTSTPFTQASAAASLTAFRGVIVATATSHNIDITISNSAATGTAQFDNVSMRELPGNHVTQPSAASRPVLTALVNLLTKTEQFSDAAWQKGQGGVASIPVITDNYGAIAAPDGTFTAARVQASLNGGTALTDYSMILQTPPGGATVAPVTSKTWARSVAGTATVQIGATNSTVNNVVLTTEWQLITHTSGAAATETQLRWMILRGGQVPANSDSIDILLWHPDFRLTADAALNIPAYQRVNTATDYDTAGFPHGEKFDGVDDFRTGASGGGGIAKTIYCAAIKVRGGAGTKRTLWSDTGTNSGRKIRINASNQLELAVGSGTALAPPVANAPTTATTGGTLAAATYYYILTALNAKGESLKSNEVSVVTTGTTSANTITWAAVTDATSYRVYRGTAAGGEDVYYAPGNVTSFTDTGAAATAGTPPTVTETAYTTVSVGALPVGETHVVTAWDDGVNVNLQIDQGAVTTVARPAIAAGEAGFTEGRDNGAVSSHFNGILFDRVYMKDACPDAATRALIQRSVARKAGLTL